MTTPFGQYLIQKITLMGISDSELARRMAYSPAQISRWTRGVQVPTRLDTMSRVADGLGVELDEVIAAVNGKYKLMSQEELEAMEIKKKHSDKVLLALTLEKLEMMTSDEIMYQLSLRPDFKEILEGLKNQDPLKE